MTRNRAAAIALFAFIVGAIPAAGDTNYWDNNGDAAGFGTAGGTWGIDSKWSADSTGTSIPGGTATTASDDLFFGTHSKGLASGTVAVDGTGQAFHSMTFGSASGTITLSGGALDLAAPASQFIVNNVSDTIATVLAGTNGLDLFTYDPLPTYTSFLTSSSVTLFSDATLANYATVAATMSGASISGGSTPTIPFFFSSDGSTATVQMQASNGGWTKCVKIELTQSGPDIAGRVIYAKYTNDGQLGFNFDTGGNDNTIALSYGDAGYGISQVSLDPTPTYAFFLTASPATLFPNATLADYATVAATMAGGAIGSSGGGSVTATPFFFASDGSTATVQLQALDGDWTKCVKIELTQSGPNIAGRALYAKYTGNGQLGFNFDTGGIDNTIASSYGDAGYGISRVSLGTFNVLTLSGVNTYSGGTAIGNGALEIGGAGQLGSGAYTGAVVNAGRFIYNSTSNQLLSGPISGTGALVKKSPAKTVSTKTYASYLTPDPTVILLNTSLSDCVGAGGKVGGAYVNNSPCQAAAYHFRRQDATVTFQLQIRNDVYTKCVKVELTQAGKDIAARAVYAKYVDGSHLGFDFDSGGNPGSIATSSSAGGYGAAETTLDISLYSKVTLSGVNRYAGGTVVDSGVLEAVASASALPSLGGITVNSAGELLLNVGGLAYNNAGGVGNGNPITVNGGMLTLASTFNAGYSRPITINGGTLNSTSTEGSGDNANYINNLALLNGARVTGYNVRVGNHSSASIAVSGTNASSIAAGLSLVKGGSETLTFNVADVTGDAGPDLLIPGVVRDYPNLGGLPVFKTGAGTLLFSGVNTHVGPITVDAGTLALGATNALNTGNALVLNGGTLDMGACSNAVGTLTVTANSVIVLGAGQLAFADSRERVWSQKLSLTGTLDAHTLRFGASADALTGEQLAAIRLNGQRVRIKADGYLAPALKGLLLSLR